MIGPVIWTAGPDDEAALVRLEALSFGERSWGENNVKASFVASGVTILLAGFVAENDKKAPSGFAMWRDLGSEAELLAIGVHPNARRSGLARKLLAFVLGAARQGGADRLFLEVDDANIAALGLYRTAGFEQISVRRAYYRDGADAIVMQIAL